MRYLLFLIIFSTPNVRATDLNRRFLFGLASLPWGRRAQPPSPDVSFVPERARHLANIIRLDPIWTEGPVPPALTYEFEIMRDWQKHHPAQSARLDQLFKLWQGTQTDPTRMPDDAAGQNEFYAKIDEGHRLWSAMRVELAEEPWASLDWARVFAEPIARMEVRLAARLQVNAGRAHQLLEHALPDRTGNFGEAGLIRDLATGFGAAGVPLYSTETLETLYAEAAGVSEAFAFALRSANDHEPERRPLRALLAKAAGLPLEHEWIEGEPLIFRLRNPEFDGWKLSEPAHYVPRYRRALANLDKIRANLSHLGASHLKTTLGEEATRLQTDLRQELATLPARLLAHANRSRETASVASWLSLADAATVTNWVTTLRDSDVGEVANLLINPVEALASAGCTPQLSAPRSDALSLESEISSSDETNKIEVR